MRKKSLGMIIVIVLMISPSCSRNRTFGNVGDGPAATPISKVNWSAISKTPVGVMLRFEAIVIQRRGQKCIEIFNADEFERYSGDPKWAIPARLGFDLGFFQTLPVNSRAAVTGKYVFVRDVHDGPCGIVSGQLFEISGIEYF
jgi:hypothetical protein